MRIIEYMRRSIKRSLKKILLLWYKWFWIKPDNLLAFKVTIAIGIMLIPAMILNQPFIGCTLALGAVGTSLSEGNDHPNGRLKSLIVTIICFLIVSLLVELLAFQPYIYAIVLAFATLILSLIGGLGSRYKGITFGALIVTIYAMLGIGMKPWYYQPILLPLGGIIYGSISLFLLYLRPYRLVKEPLATAFYKLSDYMELKAKLFPCTRQEHKQIRALLAEKNIAIETYIDATKEVIYLSLKSIHNKELKELEPLYHKWLQLQQLHERATSSHQRYDILSQNTDNPIIVRGMGLLLSEQAKAICEYASTILSGMPFKLPKSLIWTQQTLTEQLRQNTSDNEYPALSMLLENLTKLTEQLSNIGTDINSPIPIDKLNYKDAPIKQRIKKIISTQNNMFRHAVRLSITLTIGYLLMVIFNIEKGTWIPLTSFFVCQQTYIATKQRFNQRVIGTITGVALGIIFSKLLPTQAGQIILLLVSIFTFFYWVRKKYAYAVIFITIFVIVSFNLQQVGEEENIISYRLICTVIGSILAYLSVRYIWPDWQYKHLPQLMVDATTKTLRYFHTIYNTDAIGAIYYHNRRAAHKADNAIAMSWKGTIVEPKNKRIMQRKIYTLTYRHHTLLSYISALGAHNYAKQLSSNEIAICEHISDIIRQAQWNFQQINRQLPLPAIKSNDAKVWYKTLLTDNEDKNKKNNNMIIIYNIARGAYELLKESEKLTFSIKYQNNKNKKINFAGNN